MAKTCAGVVYDTRTLAVLRVIVPDDDKQLHNGTHHLQANEAMTTMSLSVYGTGLDAAKAAVMLATGRTPC